MTIRLEVINKGLDAFVVRSDEPIRVAFVRYDTGVIAKVYQGFNDNKEQKCVGEYHTDRYPESWEDGIPDPSDEEYEANSRAASPDENAGFTAEEFPEPETVEA